MNTKVCCIVILSMASVAMARVDAANASIDPPGLANAVEHLLLNGSAGAAVIAGDELSLGGETQIVNVKSGTLEIAANISNGGVEKIGPGTLLLSGDNVYTGETMVSEGKMVVNGDQSAATGTLTVASGAVLGGSGTIGGDVVLEGGAIFAPGNSPGITTINGGMTYGAASVFQWELIANTTAGRGTNYDGTNINGQITIVSGATFDIILNVGSTVNFTQPFWDAAQQWQVIDGGGNGGLTGAFTIGNISTDSLGQSYGSYGSFSLSYAGKDVYLNWSPVPEVSSITAGMLLGAGLVYRRRIHLVVT